MSRATTSGWSRCASITVAIIYLAGCTAAPQRETYLTVSTSDAASRARMANQRGLALARAGDLLGAEGAFREALREDIAFAAAHNNLGLVLLKSGRLYDAAMEFKLASRVAPEAPEPYFNLGRVYERAGWLEDAALQYEQALSLSPKCPETMGRLARVYQLSQTDPRRLDELLRQITALEIGGVAGLVQETAR